METPKTRFTRLIRSEVRSGSAESTSTNHEPSDTLETLESPKKLEAPEIRELTLAEQQQLRDLGKAMAEQALRILSRGRSLGCANLRKYLTEFGVGSNGTKNSAKAFSFLNTRSDFLTVAVVPALLATPSAAFGDLASSASVAARPTRGDDVLEDHGGSILCPRAGHSAPS